MLLLIQPEYPPAVGGMQTHASAMARCLHERGHKVAVVCYAQCEDPRAAAEYDAAQPFPTYRCLSRLSYWASIDTLKRLVGQLQPRLIYSSTPFYGILRELTGVPVVCRSAGNDIIRCWIPYPFRMGSSIVAIPGVERRLESLYHRLHAPDWVDDIFFQARRRLVQRGAMAASAVIANSVFTQERLLELGASPASVSVVAGGVYSSRFGTPERRGADRPSGPRRGAPALLTVCRLVGKKGIDVLLRAMAATRQQLPSASLVVVGDGPERARCQALSDSLGLDGSVRFVGRIPHDQVVQYYHASDCFVLASRIHRRRKGWADVETMGRVICEANAAGVPVIATNTGGIPSLVDHERNGLLVPPDDPSALASAIVDLWQQPALRTRLREEGLHRARNEFDWEVIVSAYERVFESVIN